MTSTTNSTNHRYAAPLLDYYHVTRVVAAILPTEHACRLQILERGSGRAEIASGPASDLPA